MKFLIWLKQEARVFRHEQFTIVDEKNKNLTNNTNITYGGKIL